MKPSNPNGAEVAIDIDRGNARTERRYAEVVPGFRIGRDSSAELVIDHPSVSRAHVELRVVNEVVEIKDLSSSYGVQIGTQRAAPEEWSTVGPHQKVWLGDVALFIRLRRTAVVPSTFAPTVALVRNHPARVTISANERSATITVSPGDTRTLTGSNLPTEISRGLSKHLPIEVNAASSGAVEIRTVHGVSHQLTPASVLALDDATIRAEEEPDGWNLQSTALRRDAAAHIAAQAPADNEAEKAASPIPADLSQETRTSVQTVRRGEVALFLLGIAAVAYCFWTLFR